MSGSRGVLKLPAALNNIVIMYVEKVNVKDA